MQCPGCKKQMVDGHMTIKTTSLTNFAMGGVSWEDCVFVPTEETKDIKEHITVESAKEKTAYRCYKCGIVLIRDKD